MTVFSKPSAPQRVLEPGGNTGLFSLVINNSSPVKFDNHTQRKYEIAFVKLLDS